ncbi:MAG TPA: alanine racemase [Kiloniellales bacterium]
MRHSRNPKSDQLEESPAALRAGAILSIDLAALAENYRILAGRAAAGVGCAAVVKADAYGLGVDRAAPALSAAGCRHFFVAQIDEGIRLRGLLPDAEIHVLGGLLPGLEDAFLAHRLRPTLNSLGEIETWAGHARRQGEALAADLHVDTGMRRLGLPPDELDRLAGEPDRLAGIEVSLLISHLACAEQRDHPLNARQLADFRRARDRLPSCPASFANSSGVFLGADYHFDLLRPGVALYGSNPTPDRANPMRDVVRLQGRIWQVRNARPGETVGYGATYQATRPMRIATVALGYGDGYPRALSNRGQVYVDGRAAPVIGRISMDSTTIDVTALPESRVRPGALVDVIGPDNPIDAVAAAAGTVAYELLTHLGRRYHRVYVG